MDDSLESEKRLGATATPRRVMLLVNRYARSGNASIAPAIEVFEKAGIDVFVETAASPGEMGTDIMRRGGDADAIMVGGGDGTLNAAAPGIVETGLPLAILPLGTANDLARTLRIPTDPADAARVVLAGHRRRIDLGYVNDHPFFNVASIGLSVELADALTPHLKRRWGKLSYVLAGLRVVTRARPFRAWIAADEHGTGREVRSYQIAVGNGRHYGGGMVVEHEAEIDDETLDLYSLEMKGVLRLALLAGAFQSGRQGLWHEVRTAKGQGFLIQTRKPRSINADGEIVGKTPARFRVSPGAITVFAPAADGGKVPG
ncbi:MAG: lipid kinase [Pseudomonadota bacterium]